MRQSVRQVLRQLRPAFAAIVIATVVLGFAYPLLVTGIGQAAFRSEADGSLIERDGRVVGSRLIGRQFDSPGYFHPRPSATGGGYDASASGASNAGPANPDYLKAVADRAQQYRRENDLPPQVHVPADAVQASGSGLDPEISIRNALLQAPRVAQARHLPLKEVLALVDSHVRGRPLGILGDPGVDVLGLNLALDRRAPAGAGG